MKSKHFFTITVATTLLLSSWIAIETAWLKDKQKGYTFFYTAADTQNKKEYIKLTDKGIIAVKKFFKSSFNKEFDIFVHPNRKSLDSTWQKDWAMSNFKSECWMVASGVATKLDMISPKNWDTDACEHKYRDNQKTQQLITHELVHVFHGQRNQSPDFSNAEGIDWFVEGLATYASGQCDIKRIADVKKALSENKIPAGLDQFWTGKIKYGLSGSIVQFIDHKYGRDKLIALLPFNKKSDILSNLNTTEQVLLDEWKAYIQGL
ncbi:hypothetical protein NAT51_16165 [Flavobacterium amniphilum]|uniref:hypothetical protein n=1 Tax=Flavobacterium amniphilum TaxID=1834035 RepID=UPI002029B598|nr:hypothetical protein [Flavobacterium amniphilum]MCL9807071.1 hypothetical protein [Flavobacterium amniphilum]